MIAFFRKRPGLSREHTNDDTELFDEFQALPLGEREMVAAQLSQLRDWFDEEFGGAMGFLVQPPSEQESYIQKLNRLIQYSRPKKSSELCRFYYSAAFLSLYLELLRSRKNGTGETGPLSKID